MACAYKHPECSIGVIVGTGTNAAYVEQLDNVGTYQGPKPKVSHRILSSPFWNFKLDFGQKYQFVPISGFIDGSLTTLLPEPQGQKEVCL